LNCPRAEGVDRLYLSGEIERELANHNRRNSIPLNDETLAHIIAAGEGLNVNVATLLEAAR
jgi:LDH2 family malate/lactate/ureidoglycolate dehydrogenase